MSTTSVPQQPQPTQGGAPPPAAPPGPATPPHASEATRLLCAGTYLDSGYRDRVIEQLHLNEQRIVAPSLGLDAARVLAHALRARRQELLWAGLILGLWVIGLPLTGGLLFVFLGPSLMLAAASWVRGKGVNPPLYRRVPAFVMRWWGRLVFAMFLILALVVAFGGGEGDSSSYGDSGPFGDSYSSYDDSSDLSDLLFPDFDGVSGLIGPAQAWLLVVVFALIAVCVAAQRGQFARAVGAELSPQRFPDAAGDPAERAEGQRFQRLKQRIRIEQHAPLVMYHEKRPFCGAGAAYETWVIAVELRPDEMKKEQLPLNNRAVLEKIRPLLEQLRLPSEFAGHTVRDRLRWLEIDECVFLPAEGLRRREEAPYHPQAFEDHRARAVEEGAEKRRHFLRIRVGGWEEELVVTVFVRVHTQGRMLMLEIAPHVLLPVREDFKDADRTAHTYRHNNVLGKAAWAVARVPGSAARSLATLGRGVGYAWKLLTGGYAGALPDGPALSVRELGSTDEGSRFQEMDAYRYLRSVQDRVAHGVLTALAESGYQTGEFVQKIVNISSGGVNVEGGVHGSTFAVGKNATASSTTGGSGAAAQKGTSGNGNG
ncbi:MULTISPECIES: hypothetical protein [unclassified Streptomyces]|uniref:hypothetical protein n=1 Tax=unclassified Streptomyces TaxID=2593676 RepID=UPI002474657F|nr:MULTISPECIES: hypothetical protein [unclassified Streptomyces]MDH6452353.1 hypothetical protein [Streptomyces sp. SAI-119]MDH6497091.1 hypothetical protein [Streptomyces sp. SAI-149]